MRILVLSPHFPRFPGTGAPTRLYCLLREGAARHRYHLIAASHYGDAPDPALLEPLVEGWEEVTPPSRPSGRLHRWAARVRRAVETPRPQAVERLLPLKEGVQTRVRACLATFRPDLVQVEHTVTAPLLGGLTGLPPRIVVVHDLVHRIQERAAAVAPDAAGRAHWSVQARRMKDLETRLFRSDACFVTCSEDDRAALLELAPGARVTVVPNGVDVDYFAVAPPGDPGRLVFTGNMESVPNADAVRWFCAEVLERVPGARLDIVGLNPTPEVQALEGPRVAVHGAVPDVRPFVAGGGVFIVPLRIGSGTRLKILEAMAMGRPVVSTRVGAEGLGLTHGEEALLADTPQDFADAVRSLMDDPALRQRLAERGRRLAEERFAWKVLAPAMDRACEECAATRV